MTVANPSAITFWGAFNSKCVTLIWLSLIELVVATNSFVHQLHSMSKTIAAAPNAGWASSRIA